MTHSPSRPRILVLMSDEHRADIAGFAGDPVVRTPNLDWLAAGGVTCSNASTPSPICVPARQCTLAGHYPKTCGCEGWIGLAPGYQTYPRHAGRYGYRSAAFGKLHLQGPDQMQGFQERPVGDVLHSAVSDPIEVWEPRFPSDDHAVLPGMDKWTDEEELRRAGPGPVLPEDQLAVLGFEAWVTARISGTDYDKQDPDRPLLLQLGLLDPHYPYTADRDLFTYYLNRVPPVREERPFDHPFLGLSPWPPRRTVAGEDLPRRVVQRARAAYYAKVETMDRHIGRALDALRHAGEDLDDWIIVYLSDHGEMLGEHAVWEKQKFFRESVRVPLVIRAPRLLPQGRTVTTAVNLVDLFPTLCDLAGMAVPAGLDGSSIVPFLRGETEDGQRESCSFFLQQGFSNGMIQRGDLVYQWYEQAEQGVLPEVLFDHECDPGETRNHITNPAHAEAVAAFRRRRVELGYPPGSGAQS